MRLRRNEHLRAVSASSVSQAFSAASNFVILIALGRVAGASEVGEYALAFAAYAAALVFQRAALTGALMARAPGSTAPVTVESGNAITLSLLFSGGAALVALIVGLLSPYNQLALIAPFLFGALVEDTCRYLLFRRGQHGLAVVVDGIWLTLSCAAFLVLHKYPNHNAAIVVWGIAGTVAGAAGVIIVRVRLQRPRNAFVWWRTHLWRSSRWLTVESFLASVDLQIVAFGFTAVAGAKLFGEYQIALSLVGASLFLTAGIGVVAITHLTRTGGEDRRTAMLAAIACFVCVVAWTLVVVGMSGFIVRLLYGGRVEIPTGMLLAAGAVTAVAATVAGPQSLLMVRQTERVLPVARGIAVAIFPPIAVIVSRWNFDAAIWILVLDGFSFLVIVSWAAFRRHRVPAPDPAAQRETGQRLIEARATQR